jgi:hypothetical protein
MSDSFESMIAKISTPEGGFGLVWSSLIGMGDEFHFTAARLLEHLERNPETVRSHVESCEACLYVLALVRRASGEPTPEQSEVVVDALRDWSLPRSGKNRGV